METKECIFTRRSVRNFLEKPVEKEKLDILIDAAIQAPSAMNSQPWAFAFVLSKERLKEISDRSKAHLLSILDHRPMLQKYRTTLENPGFNLFYNAPALVLVCSKPDCSPNPSIDCALAADNLMLMARNLELGTCWIGLASAYLNTPEGKQYLGIPGSYGVVAPIIVGYSESEQSTMDRNPPEVLFRMY